MIHWPFLLANRFLTSDSRRTARVCGMAPRWLVQRMADSKLVRTLRHVWKHSPYQRERWQQAGIRFRDLRSPGVLPHIPCCDPAELATHPEAFYCVPPDQFTDVLSTSGTTGVGKKIYFTDDDVTHQARMIGTYLRRLEGASRLMVIFSQTYRPASSPDGMAKRGCQEAGIFGLVAAAFWPAQTHLDAIRDYGIDTIIATPARMHKLTLEADIDLHTLGVKYIMLSSESWSETLRELLQDAWGATVLDTYACNESGCGIASECVQQNGLHIGETDFRLEIIEPETGEPAPEGTEGEIVFTTLSRRGMPLVRYRIGDLASLLPDTGRCTCGLPLRKLSRIRGRADNVIILGGGFNVYPDAFDEAILGVPGVTDYQLVIEKVNHKDLVSLAVETDLPDEKLETTLTRALRSMKPIEDSIDLYDTLVLGTLRSAPRGSLSAGRKKTQRIVDKRT